jgi:hypothetical protein
LRNEIGLPQGSLRAASALAIAVWAAPAAGLDLEYVQTKELRVVYFDPESYFVPHAAQSFLSGLASQRSLFNYVPDVSVTVLLEDFSDLANASTLEAPRNRIFLDVAPSNRPYETVSSGDRLAWTALHELTHLAMRDRASPDDVRFRRLFHGKVAVDAAHPESLLYSYLTVPRETAPRWYHEGGAVFMETWLNGGVGRAQGGYDEMVFRAMVQDNARFYDPLGLVSKGTEVDFQTGANAYLYGTRFMDYLALTYGPQRLLSWWRRDASSRRYYADDFRRVFGLPLGESWRQWLSWEHRFQQQNLQAVHEHPLTEFRDLTHKELGAVSRTYVAADGSRIFAGVKYPGQVAHIVSIDRRDGTVTELKEIKGPSGYTVTSLGYDAVHGTLFYTTDNNTGRNLEALDLHSGKSRRLLKAARIGDLVYDPTDRSLLGLRLNNGFAMLVRVPFPYHEWKTLYVFQPGEIAFDLDLSPDGTLVSLSLSGPGDKPGSPWVTQVRVFSIDVLAKGEATPLHTFQMGAAVPEGFVFSKDGRYLYGSSYYTGVSNIYRYELASGKLLAVSNAAIGFVRPLPVDDSQLIVLRYSATGFVPTLIEARPTEDLSAVTFLGAQVAERYPEVQHWVAANPSTIPYESQILRRGAYRPTSQLTLDSLIPVVEGYKDSVGLGDSAHFGDPIGFESLTIDASYSPDHALPSRERLHLATDFHFTSWDAGVAWNRADFYDLFGPTKRSLAGYNGYVGYDRAVVYDPPQTLDVIAKIAYYGDLDALPGFQNVASPSRNLFTASAGIVGVDTRRSPGAVDAETGHLWSVKAHAYGALGDFIPSLTATFDIGFPLPLDHSSIWLRSGASVSSGARTNPLANSYLGGFGNNYVDSSAHGGAQRYRDLLSMPGFDLDALQGKSLVKSMLEWCLPPLRFEALGSPGFYASWARPEIFFSALETDPDSRQYRRGAREVGAQLDFQLQVLHREPMMLSVGAARGFGGGGLGTSGFMLSLQVL